ncbi:hypothetical protein [Desulfobacca acetoxidans]
MEATKSNTEDQLIQEAVKFINEQAKAADECSYKIGEYILEKFFEGKIEKVLSKDRKKPVTLRSLLKNGDLLVSPGRLSEATRVVALRNRLKDSNMDLDGISYSHLAELIKLGPDKEEEQAKFLAKIREGKLSTRALAREVWKVKYGQDKPSQNGAQTAGPEDTRTRNQGYCRKTIALFSEIPDDCNFDELFDNDFNTEEIEALQDLASQMAKVLAKAIAFKDKCEGLLPKLQACINERTVTASEQPTEEAVQQEAA